MASSWNSFLATVMLYPVLSSKELELGMECVVAEPKLFVTVHT